MAAMLNFCLIVQGPVQTAMFYCSIAALIALHHVHRLEPEHKNDHIIKRVFMSDWDQMFFLFFFFCSYMKL